MLDGECKIEFEKWYDDPQQDSYELGISGGHQGDLHPSREYGVKIDFFDSVGIDIMVGAYGYDIKYDGNRETRKTGKTRPEARSAAITKANELFNLRRESK